MRFQTNEQLIEHLDLVLPGLESLLESKDGQECLRDKKIPLNINLRTVLQGWPKLGQEEKARESESYYSCFHSLINAILGDDKRGSSLMVLAARLDNYPLVAEFLNAGANPDASQGVLGYTTLMIAINKGNTVIQQALINAGANANAKNKSGITPLMILAVNKSTPASLISAKMLMSAEANLDSQGDGGYTALMLATQENNAEMVKFLIGAGANVLISSEQTQHDALDLAKANKNTEITRMLAEAIASKLVQGASTSSRTKVYPERTYKNEDVLSIPSISVMPFNEELATFENAKTYKGKKAAVPAEATKKPVRFKENGGKKEEVVKKKRCVVQ